MQNKRNNWAERLVFPIAAVLIYLLAVPFLITDVQASIKVDYPEPPAYLAVEAIVPVVHPNVTFSNTTLFTEHFSFDPLGKAKSKQFLVGYYDPDTVTNQTGNYTTDIAVDNNHLMLTVWATGTNGTIAVTGAKVDETAGNTALNHTETIFILANNTGLPYQTEAKWWVVESVDVSNITSRGSLDYDIGIVGYADINNNDFRLRSYRAEAVADGPNPDYRLIIRKVDDLGNDHMSLIVLEDFEVDGTADTYTDYARSGARNYTSPIDIWPSGQTLVFKLADFQAHFPAHDVSFYSTTSNEGIIVSLEGAKGGTMTSLDSMNLWMLFELPAVPAATGAIMEEDVEALTAVFNWWLQIVVVALLVGLALWTRHFFAYILAGGAAMVVGIFMAGGGYLELGLVIVVAGLFLLFKAARILWPGS